MINNSEQVMIRKISYEDIEKVLEIYKQGISTGSATFQT